MRALFRILVVLLAVFAAQRLAADVVEVDRLYQDFISGVSANDSATVNRLLWEGYDYRAAIPRNNSVSPLMIAAGSGRMAMLRLFLLRGDDVNGLSAFNETAFTRAVWEEHFPEAETLLAHGADPTLGVVGNGHPALDDCYNRMFGDAARRSFLDLMVSRTPSGRARAGLSPALPTVLDHDDTTFARLLLEAGADANYRTILDSSTLLMRASAKGSPGIVRVLLAHGADVNAGDARGVTAMMWALANLRWNVAGDIERDYQDVVVQLLAAKPDLSKRATLELLHTPTGSGTGLDMARLYVRQGMMTPIKQAVLASVEQAYRAAGLFQPDPKAASTAKQPAKKKPKSVARKKK